MATWPTVAAVQSALGTTEHEDAITAATAAAIEQVAHDVGYRIVSVDEESGDPGTFVLTAARTEDDTPEEIEPSWSLRQAALILAVMSTKAPDAPFGVAAVFDTGGLRVAAQHPTYLRMLVGQRLSYGLA